MSRGRTSYDYTRPSRPVDIDNWIAPLTDLPISSGRIYATLRGRKYASWITGRSGLTTSDFIESPPYLIESIFRDVLGITEINNASFDSIITDRSLANWKFAKSLIEQNDSLEIIKQLCYDSGTISTRNERGQEELISIANKSGTLPIINDSDIMRKNNKAPEIVINILQGTYNDFKLEYFYDYPKESYTKQLYCNKDIANIATLSRSNVDGYGSNYKDLCANNFSRVRKINKWEYSSSWIRSEAVAELFLKFMMNYNCIIKYLCEMKLLYTEKSLALEIGDKVLIKSDLLPNSVSETRQFICTHLIDGCLEEPGIITAEFLMIPQII